MFVYRPPKGSAWGHALRQKDPLKIKEVLDAFLDAYFERVESPKPGTEVVHQGPSRTTLVLAWRHSILPTVDWPEVFLGEDMQKFRRFLFIMMGNRVMFPMGILFPISPTEAASFEFLRRFNTDAPFKMSAKHFMVGMTANNGKFTWRKPDADIMAKLEEYMG